MLNHLRRYGLSSMQTAARTSKDATRRDATELTNKEMGNTVQRPLSASSAPPQRLVELAKAFKTFRLDFNRFPPVVYTCRIARNHI
jgi:hypothetical protein